jgi:membrane dipeptidase
VYGSDREITIGKTKHVSSLFMLIILVNLAHSEINVVRKPARADCILYMRSEKLHSRLLVVDMHTDALYSHVRGMKDIAKESDVLEVDIPRLQKGGVDVQVFAIWPNPRLIQNNAYGNFVLGAIDSFLRVCRDESLNVSFAVSPEDVFQAITGGKIAALLGVEGGHALEGKLEMIDTFYNKGVRVMTITWNKSNEIGDAQLDSYKPHNGLSEFGISVIKKMNELGMIIDVSHADDKTLDDVLTYSTAPVIASHSNVRALSNHLRNLTDGQIKAIAEKGGVIGVMFWAPALKISGDGVTVGDVLDHIDYVVRLVGIDHVAIGSDYDGLMRPPPQGLEDASKFPNLTKGLLKRGYTLDEIQKIMGGNFIRIWDEVYMLRNTRK